MQEKFRLAAALAGILLFVTVIAAAGWFDSLPNRQAAPPAVALLELEPIEIPAAELEPLELVGAWRLTSSEPRVGAVSGVAIDGEEIVAITDEGVVLRFPKTLRRQLPVRVRDLPAGPGDERFKINRDSEAIARDRHNRGWWVAFENRDELWLYDSGFDRALQRIAIPRAMLSFNTGVEGLANAKAGIAAFPESGGAALSWRNGRWAKHRLGNRNNVSGAVRLDSGWILLVQRDLTVVGFRNALALTRADGAMFPIVWRKRLPVSRLDNFEAVAAERIEGGAYRLWLMSDDNVHPRLRTVLLVVDLPAAALPKR